MSAAVTTTFKEITTDIPARMDRLPWSNFHLLVVIALGSHLGPRRIGGHPRRFDRPDPPGQANPQPDRPGHRQHRGLLRRRRRGGGPAVRLAHRPLRPPADLQPHARHLHGGRAAHRLRLELLELRLFRLHHRPRHRRRIRGDQLRHRRVDPRSPSRPHRPDRQRQLLGWRRGRRRRISAVAVRPASSASISAGASASASARCSAASSCSSAATCPRARAGRSPMAARRKPSKPPARSSERSARICRRRKTP